MSSPDDSNIPQREAPRVYIADGEGLAKGCFRVPPDFPLMRNAMQLLWSSLGAYDYPGDVYELGSCFMLSEGIAVTATHCVDWARDKIERDGNRHPPGEHRLNLGIAEPVSGLSMRVTSTTTFGDSEVTLLYVDRHESLASHPLPPPLTLRTTRLRADEPLTLVGFAGQDVWLEEEVTRDKGSDHVVVESIPVMGVGFVDDPDERFLIPDSTVRINGIEAMPGMSGGPVFDEAGRVIGLVSRSLEYTTVARWSQAFMLPGPREAEGYFTISASDGSSFAVYVNNWD